MKRTATHFCLLLLLCLLVLGAGGCRKTGASSRRHITGRVVDATTGEAIPKAILYVTTTSGCASCPTGTPIGRVVANDDGTFDIDAQGNYGVGIWAYYPRYERFTDAVYASEGDHGLTIKMNPLGYVKVHIKNVPPEQPQTISFVNTYCLNVFSFSNRHLDTVIYGETAANKNLTVSCRIGSPRSPTDSIYDNDTTFFLPRFDTTAIEILY